jgi:hypothetical protein
MIKRLKKNSNPISSLNFEIEVINPIESKSLFGGGWYEQLNNVNVGGYSSYGYGADYQLSSGMYDYGTGWNNVDSNGNYFESGQTSQNGSGPLYWWIDENGDGINDTVQNLELISHYPGEELSSAEKEWLFVHLNYLSDMIENKNIAELYGENQHNGIKDSLRHALWSALDASDIGYENAKDFHTLHELEHPNTTNPAENYSDINNNNWGYSWAITFGNPENNMSQFLTDFYNAAQNGEISIIPQN